MDYSELFKLIKTRVDVDDVVMALDVLRDKQFKKARTMVRADLAQVFAQHPDWLVRDQVSILRQQVLDLRVFRLTVAISPSQALVDQASAWVKQQIGPDVILDFQVDASLVGGAVIEFAGKFGNYSLKDQLEARLHEL